MMVIRYIPRDEQKIKFAAKGLTPKDLVTLVGNKLTNSFLSPLIIINKSN